MARQTFTIVVEGGGIPFEEHTIKEILESYKGLKVASVKAQTGFKNNCMTWWNNLSTDKRLEVFADNNRKKGYSNTSYTRLPRQAQGRVKSWYQIRVKEASQ